MVPIFLQEFSPRFQTWPASRWNSHPTDRSTLQGKGPNGWITSETSHVLAGRKFIITTTTYKIFSQTGIASFILIGLNRAAAPIQDETWQPKWATLKTVFVLCLLRWHWDLVVIFQPNETWQVAIEIYYWTSTLSIVLLLQYQPLRCSCFFIAIPTQRQSHNATNTSSTQHLPLP